MLRPIRIVFRLIQIVRSLARHDALAPLDEFGLAPGLLWAVRRLAGVGSASDPDRRAGEKLAAALTELGPTFIKLGQFLSTRADLVGEEIAADLAHLQDHLPPFDSVEVRSIIEAELGQPLDRLFTTFEEQPLSAASIAQVHLAVTRPLPEAAALTTSPAVIETAAQEAGEHGPADAAAAGLRGAEAEAGQPVAVKVLRPGVEAAFERDFAVFYWLAELVERTQPKLRRFRPVAVVELFESMVAIEMDLRMEAAAASELAENFEDDPTYRVPAVDWARCSQRVLTMERIEGIRLDNREALIAAGHDLEAVLGRAAAIFFKQVFRDGFFHGDQHPGNMFVGPDGAIVAVDFGIMGRLDYKTRCHLADMLMATLARDYRRLAAVQRDAGYLPQDEALDVYAQALRSVCEPITGRPLHAISFARLLAQLLQLTESFNMPVQPQLLLLQKNMLMAEGISRRLDPELNIWTLAQPLIADWMRQNRGPQARVREGARDLAGSLERLPALIGNIEKTAADLAGGGIRLNPESLRALRGEQGGRGWFTLALSVIALVLALAALID